MTAGGGDLGLSFRTTKTGDVAIRRGSVVGTILRGAASRKFLAAVARLPAPGQQQVMAWVTGNDKRGTERLAGRYPRRGAWGEWTSLELRTTTTAYEKDKQAAGRNDVRRARCV